MTSYKKCLSLYEIIYKELSTLPAVLGFSRDTEDRLFDR